MDPKTVTLRQFVDFKNEVEAELLNRIEAILPSLKNVAMNSIRSEREESTYVRIPIHPMRTSVYEIFKNDKTRGVRSDSGVVLSTEAIFVFEQLLKELR